MFRVFLHLFLSVLVTEFSHFFFGQFLYFSSLVKKLHWGRCAWKQALKDCTSIIFCIIRHYEHGLLASFMQPMFFLAEISVTRNFKKQSHSFVSLLSHSWDLLKHFQYTETPGGYSSCYFLVSFPCRGSNEAVRHPVASARALTEQGVGDIFLF